MRKRDRAEAECLHAEAKSQAKADKEAQAKEKADRDAAELEKQRKELAESNQKAEAKRKLDEAKAQEAKAAAEAKQLSEAEAKRQAQLDVLRTKKAEKIARAAQKEAAVDMAPKDIPPKPVAAPVPEAHVEAEHSEHNFPDAREGELWDCLSLNQAFCQLAEAVDPKAVDVGNIYISPTLSGMIETLYNQLRDLHARDRSETAKILKFTKKADAESDEDFKIEAIAASKKIADVNEKTKRNIQVYQGKIKSAVEDCCKTTMLQSWLLTPRSAKPCSSN